QLIYLMNIDGSGIERVTQLRSRKPSWSPDGLQIAFTSVADTIIVADLQQPREIALGGGASADWSPDAQQLVVDVPFPVSGIGIVAADGTGRRMLTPGAAFFSEPDWSPLGDWIAFADSLGSEWDIFLLPTDCLWDCEPQRIQLTSAGSRDIMPDWSRDGARIAYVCDVDVCVLHVATGAIERLTRLPPYAGAGAPAWRP
ncbi:MAG: hypothetical protein SF123_06400, partial [Chloroflexota bacterium]|nr:hypothetical protein [Chloroflexota bacterium]